MADEKKMMEELVSFLRSKKPEIRQAAVDGIATTTNSLDGIRKFKDTHAIRFLCQMVGDSDPKIARGVLSALINMSLDPFFLQQMIVNHVVSRLIDSILDNENKTVELSVILLSNVSRDPKGARKVAQAGDALQGYYVRRLFELFVDNDKKQSKEDPFSWVASILSNVTQIPEGRTLVLDKTHQIFLSLLEYINHPNLIRRRGVLGVIRYSTTPSSLTARNCLFESSCHAWVMGDEVDILPKLLLPIRGPEVYSEEDLVGMPQELQSVPSDKQRESDVESRTIIVDSLLLLAATKKAREEMRKKQVYLILRDFDEVEEDEGIKDGLLKIINLLKGLDEPKHDVNFNPIAKMDATPHVIDPQKILTKHGEKPEPKETEPKIEVEVIHTPEPTEKKTETEPAKPAVKSKSSKTFTTDVDEEGDLIEEI